MKKALVLYCSITGNTEKAARAIAAGLKDGGLETTLLRFQDAGETDYFDYDLVCIGTPSYSWTVPKLFNDFLTKNFEAHKKAGKILPGSPRVGKSALVFCTYSGPHTGISEAVPAGLYVGQFFDHIGFDIADTWYILSEFINNDDFSTKGRMGDIRGLPSEADLKALREKARALAAGFN